VGEPVELWRPVRRWEGYYEVSNQSRARGQLHSWWMSHCQAYGAARPKGGSARQLPLLVRHPRGDEPSSRLWGIARHVD
jgi:hypothetical protein